MAYGLYHSLSTSGTRPSERSKYLLTCKSAIINNTANGSQRLQNGQQLMFLYACLIFRSDIYFYAFDANDTAVPFDVVQQ